MTPERCLVFEQHIEEPGGPTIGWLARYGQGRAIWCGEFSRGQFMAQPAQVRQALRDDLGWFVVDYQAVAKRSPIVRVLAKAACERTALELLSALVKCRLSQSSDASGSTFVQLPEATRIKLVFGKPSDNVASEV
jgi:hypothetical protein